MHSPPNAFPFARGQLTACNPTGRQAPPCILLTDLASLLSLLVLFAAACISHVAYGCQRQPAEPCACAFYRECDDEAIRHELSQYTAEMKLTLATNLGSLLALVAFLVSWLTGEDPLGECYNPGRVTL